MTLCRRVQGVEIEGLIISLSQAPCRFDPVGCTREFASPVWAVLRGCPSFEEALPHQGAATEGPPIPECPCFLKWNGGAMKVS